MAFYSGQTLMSHLYRVSGCNIPITNNILETRRLVLLCVVILLHSHTCSSANGELFHYVYQA